MVALAACLTLPLSSQAVETTWRFEGTVTSIEGTWNPSPAIGSAISGSFVIDRDQTFVDDCLPPLYRTVLAALEGEFDA